MFTAKPTEICFDMDGTIADLYMVNHWLERIRAEDATPYMDASPMWDMARLAEVLHRVQATGIRIRVITWLSKGSTESFKAKTREAKRDWLSAYGFPFDAFNGVQYGATKADSVRRHLEKDETAWLFDDNAKVREGWHLGETFDPTACDIIEVLESLL